MNLSIEMAKPVGKAWGRLRGIPQGIMLHYDASASDRGAVAWLEDDARAEVSYHYLVLDDGRVLQIAPPGSRAWHAGVCRPSRREFTYSDGNTAFVGVAIAAKPGDVVTPAQLTSVALVCQYVFWLHGWNPADEWRITGHAAEASPRGRKVDPEGPPELARPVMTVAQVLEAFRANAWTGIP